MRTSGVWAKSCQSFGENFGKGCGHCISRGQKEFREAKNGQKYFVLTFGLQQKLFD